MGRAANGAEGFIPVATPGASQFLEASDGIRLHFLRGSREGDPTRDDNDAGLADRTRRPRFILRFDPEVELLPRPLVESGNELLESDRPCPRPSTIEPIGE